MNNNTDITIYNKYVDAGAEKWQRTVITNVQWENRKAINANKVGMIDANTATIYIPFARGANFVKPKAWLALVSKTGYWTLKPDDIIVKGSVADEIHAAIVSPPSAAFTITNLIAKYDDVVKITIVDTMDMGSAAMQHWEVGCK